jgi:hypothetical protein
MKKKLKLLQQPNPQHQVLGVHSSASAIAEQRKKATSDYSGIGVPSKKSQHQSKSRSSSRRKEFSPIAEDAAAFGYHAPKLKRIKAKVTEESSVPISAYAAAYHRGYMQKSKERGEFYLTVLNDLAEDTIITSRISRENLCEVLGWMQREHGHMVDHMNTINGELAVLMSKSLVSQMQKGLFHKGRSKHG